MHGIGAHQPPLNSNSSFSDTNDHHNNHNHNMHNMHNMHNTAPIDHADPTTALNAEKRAMTEEILQWMRSKFCIGFTGSLPKSLVYSEYKSFCQARGWEASSAAGCGRLVHKAFPNIVCIRKGGRKTMKYHYQHLCLREPDGSAPVARFGTPPVPLRSQHHHQQPLKVEGIPSQTRSAPAVLYLPQHPQQMQYTPQHRPELVQQKQDFIQTQNESITAMTDDDLLMDDEEPEDSDEMDYKNNSYPHIDRGLGTDASLTPGVSPYLHQTAHTAYHNSTPTPTPSFQFASLSSGSTAPPPSIFNRPRSFSSPPSFTPTTPTYPHAPWQPPQLNNNNDRNNSPSFIARASSPRATPFLESSTQNDASHNSSNPVGGEVTDAAEDLRKAFNKYYQDLLKALLQGKSEIVKVVIRDFWRGQLPSIFINQLWHEAREFEREGLLRLMKTLLSNPSKMARQAQGDWLCNVACALPLWVQCESMVVMPRDFMIEQRSYLAHFSQTLYEHALRLKAESETF